MQGLRADVYDELVTWLDEQGHEEGSIDMDAVVAAQKAKQAQDAQG